MTGKIVTLFVRIPLIEVIFSTLGFSDFKDFFEFTPIQNKIISAIGNKGKALILIWK